MLRSRIIPVLLIKGSSLVKTIRFKKYSYIGDPCNTVRIFNELEVDEISILDIDASRKNKNPQYNLIKDIASEAFMPLSYGGGINSLEKAKEIFKLGIEKVVLNTAALENPNLVREVANVFGSQAVTVSIDVKRSFFGEKYKVYSTSGRKRTKLDLISWAKTCEELGAGEIMLNNIDRDGTWLGYENNLYKMAQENLKIPLIGCGGAKDLKNVSKLLKESKCSAAGVGSMVVFQKKDNGVLINFPKPDLINHLIHS